MSAFSDAHYKTPPGADLSSAWRGLFFILPKYSWRFPAAPVIPKTKAYARCRSFCEERFPAKEKDTSIGCGSRNFVGTRPREVSLICCWMKRRALSSGSVNMLFVYFRFHTASVRSLEEARCFLMAATAISLSLDFTASKIALCSSWMLSRNSSR